MKIIAIGDKSRYQFFRAIVMPGELNSNSFKTEHLGEYTVYVVPSDYYSGDNIFHSDMLPLTTEIVFPSEIECNKYACDMDDKVILFEEFPFGKQSNSEDLDLYAKRIGAGLCEVVLVLNDRKFMDSDISTEEMAIEDIYGKYTERGFRVYKYARGDLPDFLFGNGKLHTDQNITFLKTKIIEINEEIQNIGIDYELDYELNLHKFFENPALLDSFFKYNRNNLRENAKMYFLCNVKTYFWSNRKNQYTDFYEKIYLRYIKDICVWDLQKDLDILYSCVVYRFEQYFQDIPYLSCKEDEVNYSMWIHQNMEYILGFKERIKKFFETELCLIIKEQILEKSKKLEELLDEKDN